MPRKTKRQWQVSQIPRKKGCYVSQDQLTIERDTSESEIIELIDDFVDDWTEEDLKEFKDVEKNLSPKLFIGMKMLIIVSEQYISEIQGLQPGEKKKKKRS